MKKIFYTLAMLFVSISIQAQILDGDMNHDGNLSIEDVTKLVNIVLNPSSRTYSYSVEQFIADNKLSGKYLIDGDTRFFVDGIETIHEYVDLGLPSGTLWATCNVGANSPEEYGDYFAWGETTPQSEDVYSWSSYSLCNGNYYTMKKYCTNSACGIVDNKTELDASDDAATYNWGTKWRMPSKAQQQELISDNNTTKERTTLNGQPVIKFISKQNGNYIYMPFSGVRGWIENLDGTEGSFWSRSLSIYSSAYASCDCQVLYLTTSGIRVDGSYRYFGRAIRPVRQ